MRREVKTGERETPEESPPGGERARQLRSVRLSGFLSYGHEGTEFTFGALNVLVGPNGSGKTNLIEALRVMRSSTTGFGAPMITGGGVEAYLYRGLGSNALAGIMAYFAINDTEHDHCHELGFRSVGGRVGIAAEYLGPSLEGKAHGQRQAFQRQPDGSALLTMLVRSMGEELPSVGTQRIPSINLKLSESGLEKRRDPEAHPALSSIAEFYESIAIYGEWTIGRDAPPRRSVPAGTRSDVLLEDASNLAFVLSELRATRALPEIKAALRRLKATYEDFSIRPVGGQLQLYVEEEGVVGGINAMRLSDGTLRFLALAAVLLHPKPPALVAIDEPEIGMHPDLIDAIAEMILDAAGRTQLIIATHSPELLTALRRGIDRLYAFGAGAEGTTVRGFDRAQLDAYLAEEPLGALWRQGDLGGNRF